MTEIFKELSDLLEQRMKRKSEHINGIIQTTKEVKNHFKTLLGLEGTYKDQIEDKEKPYISICTLDNEDISSNIETQIKEDGSYYFKLTVMFTNLNLGIPDFLLGIPLAIKYEDYKPKYAFVNGDTEEIVEWFNDKESLDNLVIRKIKEQWNFNPMMGVECKNIGFL